MLPIPVLKKFEQAPDAGYASVYMFDETASRDIRDSGNSAGFARFPVYTDTLTLDLDQGLEQLERVKNAITGLSYQVFDSGGKGYHIIIPLTKMMEGVNVPYYHKHWVEALRVEADLSLYQAGHIIALPGRKHPKTGRRKALVETVLGDRLTVPEVILPKPVFSLRRPGPGSLEAVLWRVQALIQAPPVVGDRHTALWGAAKDLAEIGLAYDTVLDLFQEVNKTWKEPKLPEDVRSAVQQAFRQSTSRP
jgi:hypothetical protein